MRSIQSYGNEKVTTIGGDNSDKGDKTSFLKFNLSPLSPLSRDTNKKLKFQDSISY